MAKLVWPALVATGVSMALFLAPAPEPGQEASVGQGARIEEHGRMTTPRAAHQATALDDGRVLITGGCGDPGCDQMLASAEVYDPASEFFRAAAPMTRARGSHEATRLSDGRVLVTGGWTADGPSAATEFYDPVTGAWTEGPTMRAARVSHNAVTLSDGRILLVGGDAPPQTAEIFDPAAGRFVAGPPLVPGAGTYLPTALADGRVLVTGGGETAAAQLFDPSSSTFEAVGSMTAPRTKHAAALLPDGRIVLVGGSHGGGYRDRVATTEIFDPDERAFSSGPTLAAARFKIRDAVASLAGGSVLVAGGAPIAEVLDPRTGVSRPVKGDLGAPRMFATATRLPGGGVLILGGYDTDIRPTAAAWLYRTGALRPPPTPYPSSGSPSMR